VALGAAAAALATRAMEGLLFEVRPLDPATFATVLVGAALVATLASLVPARRAASVDPIRALRSE
jgi:putative ABC transport system permease protein